MSKDPHGIKHSMFASRLWGPEMVIKKGDIIEYKEKFYVALMDKTDMNFGCDVPPITAIEFVNEHLSQGAFIDEEFIELTPYREDL